MYKVIYLNELNIACDMNFDTEALAREYAQSLSWYVILHIEVDTTITDITVE